MKLSAWLKLKDLTAQQFGERIDRAPSTITRLLRGESVPDKATMLRIVAETEGAVTPNDFFDLPESPPTSDQVAAE